MLLEADIPFRIVGGCVLPGLLDARDLPWLRVLVQEVDRFSGKRVRELVERLREPLPCEAPTFKLRAAKALVLQLWRSELCAELAPEKVREVLFCAAAIHPGARMQAVVAAERTLRLEPGRLEQILFADLPGEKRVVAPTAMPSPHELALRTNLLIVRSLLFHARRVRIRAEGAVRPVVRQAKLRGLLCTVTHRLDRPADESPVLDISGPFTVFRHTLLYGRALGELVQFLPHAARFRLRADCVLRGQEAVLELQSGDPIFPAEAAKPFDSKIEARFARDFAKLAPNWDLLREPEPIVAGRSIIFPDFLIRHRLCPERRYLLEIIGFWSTEYLQRKLASLREAKVADLILCIDEERKCAREDLPPMAQVLRFRRRIDPNAVLAIVEGG